MTARPGRRGGAPPAKRKDTLMRSNLSRRLRERYGVRSVTVRKGDTVKILRGDFAGIEGKIIETDRKNRRVTVEGVTREKVSGEQVRVPVHVSKVTVTSLDMSDRWRTERLGKRPETSQEAK
ncbi:MAG: 50S ribosomal protein L24 [Candidatus Bathyarchaeia archaeon]